MSHPRNSCPVCSSQQKKHLYAQKFSKLSGQIQLSGYNVVLCKQCGFAYADDIPGQDWFDTYYRGTSKYTHDQRKGQESPIDTARFQEIAGMIAKHLPEKDSRILDFGCATGGLLYHLKNAGYSHLLGMDKSQSAAEIARRLYSIRVVTSSLGEIAQREQPFDLLIQIGLLEHICDVRGTLAEMRSVLRLGGLMYIEVPDVVGFDEPLGAPFQQFSIEHINFFSCSTLIGLMVTNGFEPVEVIRTKRGYTLNNEMPVVCGVFRLVEIDKYEAFYLDEETEKAMQNYINRSTLVEERICRIIDELVVSRQSVLVWGVGTHTLHLLETTSLGKLNIIAFVDSNTHYQARFLLGKPVLAPSALKEFQQPILISSQVFQSEIENQIRHDLCLPNETIKLYDLTGL